MRRLMNSMDNDFEYTVRTAFLMYRKTNAISFLMESLEIEGINREPTTEELDATMVFLRGPLTVDSVLELQAVYAPGMPLRDQEGMDVRVGGHLPPRGHPHMIAYLAAALVSQDDPYRSHIDFETLHPFMDGNGRTGRTVWAWKMLAAGRDPFALSFLHRFYYDTLAASDGRVN